MANYLTPSYNSNNMGLPTYNYGQQYNPYTPISSQLQNSQISQYQSQQISQEPYDYIGKFVKSYDEVKVAPFGDKTCVYLDMEHDRIYIKEISKEGVPQVHAFGLVDIQQVSNSSETAVSAPIENSVDIDEKVSTAINKVTKDFEKRIKTLEDKVNIQKNF